MVGFGEDYTGVSSPWWYGSNDLAQLLLSAPPDATAADVIRQMGLVPPQSLGARLAETFTKEDAADLLRLLRERSKQIKPEKIGKLGRDAYECTGYAVKTGVVIEPAAYAYLQVVGDAIKSAGTLDQDKLTTYVHTHPFHTIVGDVSFGEDGDWTEAKILFEQFHDVRGKDVDQFRGGKVETILQPLSMRSGTLSE